jgi:predicted enzyme related to lactoylglutathione lyase
MSTVQTIVGKFVWHEHYSNDPDSTTQFYNQLLGWETEVWKPGEADYAMIKAGDQMHGGIVKSPEGGSPGWLGSVLVEDVDETARKAEAAGGRIVAAPMDMPDIGRIAVIADPQGAVISAYGPIGEPPNPEGTFVWDELQTSDPDAAKDFYNEIFGWTAQAVDMGPGGTYTIFKRAGDTDVAGAARAPEGAPSAWVPYIATDDVDATTSRAKELGATIVQEPTDIPGMGRFSIVQDAAGATFGLWKGSPQE